MNLELDFRRHVYGGDVGQRIELGQQHPFEDIHHRRTTACVFVLFCFEKEIFIPILSLPLFFFKSTLLQQHKKNNKKMR